MTTFSINTLTDEKWKIFFTKNEKLLKEIFSTIGNQKIYPTKYDIFNAFNLTPFDNVKVVILGQDPYKEDYAMGLSFSVPDGVKIPSSLHNIFKNMVANKIISQYPKSGDLTNWAKQGILLLNSSLTLPFAGKNHIMLWKPLIEKIIEEISKKKKVLFIVFGKSSYELCKKIFHKKNIMFSISSHPSGQSHNTRLTDKKRNKVYVSFNESNHFGFVKKIFPEIKF